MELTSTIKDVFGLADSYIVALHVAAPGSAFQKLHVDNDATYFPVRFGVNYFFSNHANPQTGTGSIELLKSLSRMMICFSV